MKFPTPAGGHPNNPGVSRPTRANPSSPPSVASRCANRTVRKTADARAVISLGLGGPLIDGVNALWPGSAAGYPVAFAFAALLTLSGAVLLARVRQSSRDQEARAGCRSASTP